jgi:hypothetical protein
MAIAMSDLIRRLEIASEKEHDVDTVLAQMERRRARLSRLGERASCVRAAEIVLEELQDALDSEEVSPAVSRRMGAVVRRVLGADGARTRRRRRQLP